MIAFMKLGVRKISCEQTSGTTASGNCPVEFGTVQQNSGAVAFEAVTTSGLCLGRLDFTLQPFGNYVGNYVIEIVQDVVEMLT